MIVLGVVLVLVVIPVATIVLVLVLPVLVAGHARWVVRGGAAGVGSCRVVGGFLLAGSSHVVGCDACDVAGLCWPWCKCGLRGSCCSCGR